MNLGDMMLIVQFIDFGFSFSLFYATHKGLGLHDYDINPGDRGSLNQANYVFTVLYVSTSSQSMANKEN